MNRLFEVLGQLEEMAQELNDAPLLKKANIGWKISKKSFELTKLSFQKMVEFEERVAKLENNSQTSCSCRQTKKKSV
jgi:hypothetical protein